MNHESSRQRINLKRINLNDEIKEKNFKTRCRNKTAKRGSNPASDTSGHVKKLP